MNSVISVAIENYGDDLRKKIKELEEKLALREEVHGNAVASMLQEQSYIRVKLNFAIEALEKCTKIRRKDGNGNEYEGAEAYIAKEALEKIKR